MAQGSDVTRVLIADDIGEVRRLLRLLLRDAPGVQVVGEAEDGLDAIELVERLHPDIVVMDIEMPRLDGIEATRRITEKWPEVRIIGCSSLDHVAVREAMHSAGAAAFLDKTYAFHLLGPLVEAVARSDSLPVVVLDHDEDDEASERARGLPPRR